MVIASVLCTADIHKVLRALVRKGALCKLLCLSLLLVVVIVVVPAGSPSHGGDVMVQVFYINQPSLPTPFYSVLVSVSVFMVLSTVFHSINSLDNSPLSHSVLPVLFLPY